MLDFLSSAPKTLAAIAIIPLAVRNHDVPEFLSFVLRETFPSPCRLVNRDISLDPFFNPERKQYHSTEILRELVTTAAKDDSHVLGIVDVDLYIPILTFVYGEAQLGNRCALMSTHRLHQPFYGLPDDPATLLERSEKEAVHELGHTLGLRHCRNYECVMFYSNAIEQIDLKRNVFCPACAKVLGLRCRW